MANHKGLLHPLVIKALSIPYVPRNKRLSQVEMILVCMHAWGGSMSVQDLKKISLAWRGDENAMLHNFNPYYGNKTALDCVGNRKYSRSMDRGTHGTYPWYRVKGRTFNYTNALTVNGIQHLKRVLAREDFREIAVYIQQAA